MKYVFTPEISAPIVECQNDNCRMTFVVFAILISDDDNQDTPNRYFGDQSMGLFCPYCGNSTKVKDS